MTVCMFPGQGSQIKGMGKGLFNRFPDVTKTASDILGYSIEKLCLEDPDKKLAITSHTQPALYVVNALAWRRYQEDNDTLPSALIGHSLGEYNALEAAGAINFEDGLRLVQQRGILMVAAPPGGMAAVIGLSEIEIRAKLADNGLDTLDIANLNTPNQIIVSGLKADISKAGELLQTDNVGFIPLRTGGAFHSRYMKAAHKEFETFLSDFSFSPPNIPVISNLKAIPYESNALAATLADQITGSVQWVNSIRYLLAQGEETFEELGPGRVLSRLVDEIKKTPSSTPSSTQDQAPEIKAEDVKGQIDNWNRQHQLGTEVMVDGYQGPLMTRTPAVILFGHRAAIYLEGYNGYFELSNIRSVT
ncbi:MAG: ACP S-malonyltransferase [Halopseudomonas aestusnigri]